MGLLDMAKGSEAGVHLCAWTRAQEGDITRSASRFLVFRRSGYDAGSAGHSAEPGLAQHSRPPSSPGLVPGRASTSKVRLVPTANTCLISRIRTLPRKTRWITSTPSAIATSDATRAWATGTRSTSKWPWAAIFAAGGARRQDGQRSGGHGICKPHRTEPGAELGCQGSLHHQGDRYRRGQCIRAARRIFLCEFRLDPCGRQ